MGRVLLAIVVLAVIPIIQTACVLWVDPPFTSLMLVRKAGAAITGRRLVTKYEWMPLEQMPRDFLTSVLIAEDQRFFRHSGFDWNEVRAARAQAQRSGKAPRGASTITMQCARSLFLWQGRSWIRKGAEIYYTFWMELFLPKKRILELYANSVELGPGIFGLKAGARAHFETTPARLSREQCVRLAALLPAPLVWSPHESSPKYDRRVRRLQRQLPAASIPGWSSG
jgi:monofunctional biosynthetic peptidoglycan transglycosylase